MANSAVDQNRPYNISYILQMVVDIGHPGRLSFELSADQIRPAV